MDKSYFAAHHVRDKRGRGSYGKNIAFGLLKCHGKVYTEIVSDCTKATLHKLGRGKVELQTVIHSDGWRSYDGLVAIGYDKHYHAHHSHNEFARDNKHINKIKRFCCYAPRLAKFNGISSKTFYLHSKETEISLFKLPTTLYLYITP